MKNLKVFNVQYEIKSIYDVFTVKILSDSYDHAEMHLRQLILKQLQAKEIQATLSDCIIVTNRSVMCDIDTITDSVYKILSNENKVDI